MVRYLQKLLIGWVVIGLFFLLGCPLLFFEMRPHDDVSYHLRQAPQRELAPATLPEHNQFVAVAGTIDAASLAANVTDLFARKLEFKFRLKEYPPNLLFYLYEGPLHEQLVAAIAADKPAARGANDIDEVAELFRNDYELDVSSPSLAELMGKQIQLQGRVYQSDSALLTEFGSMKRADEADLKRYIEEHLQGDVARDVYWVVAIGESPSMDRFWDGNAPPFVCGIFLGLVGIAAVIGWKVLALARVEEGCTSAGNGDSPFAESGFVLAEAVEDELSSAEASLIFTEPNIRIDRLLLKDKVLAYVRDRYASRTEWLVAGVIGSVIAFCIGIAMVVSVVGMERGLRLLWFAVSFEAFKRKGGRELRGHPERFHPFIAMVVLANTRGGDEETRVPALLLGSFEHESIVPLSRLSEIAREAQRRCFGRGEPADELDKMLMDGRYQENRRRRLPSSVRKGYEIYFFDALVSPSDIVHTALGAVTACLAKPGEKGELILIPWEVIKPAVSLDP